MVWIQMPLRNMALEALKQRIPLPENIINYLNYGST
ncbi:hypothetical protein NBT09_04600 [Rickettsia conorii subsp. raoultii]|uniref:Acyl-[acyl-carrier-protein]--UDP-N-acetylglucosamine O-acyltransferase n=1 Tax=Rickettsia conorii subsp. raoultii TaxID=369822 RepID=A0ABY4U415_RICCR|nr:hypothetical protein [Rickettsia conorii]URW77308.1 hypothetical protein NBT09_04600 [Rickettsia conorii subsp. raoultii]